MTPIDLACSCDGVGQRLRTLRLEAGLTQTELAQRLRTTQSAVARMESGQQRTSLQALERAARALDCELALVIAHRDGR
jgi:transcriptional regulator with XRE-family HTH domain